MRSLAEEPGHAVGTGPVVSATTLAPSALSDGLLENALATLGQTVPSSEIGFAVSLASMGRWRIGGLADAVVEPGSLATLAATLKILRDSAVPHVLIGDGTNLLFDDAGFRGVVVRMGRAFSDVEIASDGVVRAGAGIWVPRLVRAIVNRGLSGIVHAVGIPGTLGGLCVMNGGSQRKGIGDHVVHVDAMDYDGALHRLSREQLGFAYRQSSLQDGGLVVVSATLQLEPGDAAALRHEAIDILASRRAKFPKVRANCGSVFVSDPKLYALLGPPGEAIERVGLKGVSAGDAQISPDHANFIVNNGHARSRDVLQLVATARHCVADRTGVAMLAEVRHLLPDGILRPAHESAELLFPELACAPAE